MPLQFRAMLTCGSDPCEHCRQPQHTFPASHGILETWDTSDAAQQHGQKMARTLYGSGHKVTVQRRRVSDWEDETS